MISNLLDVVQILFWLTIGTVTVLTFLRARRTLLQPLRTEVFKVQLEEMRAVLRLFVGKSELDLRADAHIDELVQENAWMLLDAYQETLGAKPDREKRRYPKYRNARVRSELLTSAKDALLTSHSPSPASRAEGDVKARRVAAWGADKRTGVILLPDGLIAYEREIRSLTESPVLPTECVDMLERYLALLDQFPPALGATLETVSPELPVHYPSVEQIGRARIDWIQNEFNASAEVPSLKDSATQIVEFARNYFDSDSFASGRDRLAHRRSRHT